jgi:hypothetical protein
MRTLEVEFLGKFEPIFETALVYESGDQLGTFGEITLDKKPHATVPLRATAKRLLLGVFQDQHSIEKAQRYYTSTSNSKI